METIRGRLKKNHSTITKDNQDNQDNHIHNLHKHKYDSNFVCPFLNCDQMRRKRTHFAGKKKEKKDDGMSSD